MNKKILAVLFVAYVLGTILISGFINASYKAETDKIRAERDSLRDELMARSESNANPPKALSNDRKIADLERQADSWKQVANQILTSRGYPTTNATPDSLRRLRLKMTPGFEPIIKDGKLHIAVKKLQTPDKPMRFTRENANEFFLASRLFTNPDIISVTLDRGYLQIEPRSGVEPDAIIAFTNEEVNGEFGNGMHGTVDNLDGRP